MPEMDCAGCVVDVAIAVVDRYLNGIEQAASRQRSATSRPPESGIMSL
jgi:hypothetical protein